MSKVFRSSVIALCTLLAACADSVTSPTVTAPGARPLSSQSVGELRGAVTVDGPADLVLGSGNASSQQSSAPRAATGGRASGHVSLTLGTGFFTPIAREEYSFTALSTSNSPTPFAAKGHYSMTLTTVTGVLQEFEGTVICLAVAGNTARVVGQLTSVVVGGIPRQINPAQSHNIWSVTDNGEGQGGTPDQASPMIFFPASFAPLHCPNDFIPPQFNNEAGNIQVQP